MSLSNQGFSKNKNPISFFDTQTLYRPTKTSYTDIPLQFNRQLSNVSTNSATVEQVIQNRANIINKKIEKPKIQQEIVIVPQKKISTIEKPEFKKKSSQAPSTSVFNNLDQTAENEIQKYLMKFRQENDIDRVSCQTDKIRMKSKQRLLQILLYGITELKKLDIKNLVLNETQIVKLQSDRIYKKVLKHAIDIQKEFYNYTRNKYELMNLQKRNTEYAKKMCSLFNNLQDYRNFDLRRQILNDTLSAVELAKKEPSDLLCKQIKQKEAQKKRQILMQSTIEEKKYGTEQQQITINSLEIKKQIPKTVTKKSDNDKIIKLIQQINQYAGINRFKNRILDDLPKPISDELLQNLENTFRK